MRRGALRDKMKDTVRLPMLQNKDRTAVVPMRPGQCGKRALRFLRRAKSRNTEESRIMSEKIIVRGAKVHNLKNIDVDIPLHKIVGDRRSVRLREVLAGAGGAVCGRLPPVPRVALDLYPAAA